MNIAVVVMVDIVYSCCMLKSHLTNTIPTIPGEANFGRAFMFYQLDLPFSAQIKLKIYVYAYYISQG